MEACKNSEEPKEIKTGKCRPDPLENGGKECDGDGEDKKNCVCPSMKLIIVILLIKNMA